MNNDHTDRESFGYPEEAAAFDRRFRDQVQAALDDSRPSIPHDQVMAEMDVIIAKARECRCRNPQNSTASIQKRPACSPNSARISNVGNFIYPVFQRPYSRVSWRTNSNSVRSLLLLRDWNQEGKNDGPACPVVLLSSVSPPSIITSPSRICTSVLTSRLMSVGDGDATGRIFKSSVGAFRMAMREAGIELMQGQLTYVLRHTFASHFMMNGGNNLALQIELGHSSLQTSMVYAHLSPDHLQEAKLRNPLTRLTVG